MLSPFNVSAPSPKSKGNTVMRAFNRFLLAGTSHLAILMMGGAGAWAASITLGSESDGSTYTAPAEGITGTNSANGSNGDTTDGGNGNGQNAGWSYGLLIDGADITIELTTGTIIGGIAGKGGDAAPGAYDGGHGGFSSGLIVKGDDAKITVGEDATIKGGQGGAGGAAGGSGGTAGSGSPAYGVTIFGERAELTNNGTIETGTSGAAGSANGGVAGESWGSDAVRIGLKMQGQETYIGEYANFTNNGTVKGYSGTAVAAYAANATIINNRDGVITSNGGEESETVMLYGGKATLVNYGTIENTNFDNHAYAVSSFGADKFGSEYASSVTNYGTINGNVYIGPYDRIFLNGGRITGNLKIEDTTTRLTLGSNTVNTIGGAIRGSGSIYTEIGNGVHGYLVNSSTSTDLSEMTIVPVVSGSVNGGAKYVLIVGYNGNAVMPSVTKAGGYIWRTTLAQAEGQTDSDGVSYGNSNYALVLQVANNTPIQAASGTNGAGVKALATYSGNNAGLQALSQAVNGLTNDSDIKKAGAQLRPETTGNTAQASMGAVTQALSTIQVRTDAVRVAASETGTGVSSGETLKGLGVWGQGFGSTASQGERNDVSGYDADTYGLAFGADFKVIDPLRVGLSFAYAKTNVDSTGDRSGSGQDIDSYITSLYGTYSGKGWYVDGALTYGIHKYDATRHVAIAGAAAQNLKASYDGQQVGAKAEVGVPLAVGPAVVTPLASLAYNNLKQDSYSETGGAAALEVGSSSTDSIRSGLGAKVSAKVATLGNWEVSPNARAVWHHEFNKSSQDQTSAYVAGGSSFTTPGTDIATEHFNLGLGVDVASVRNTTISAKYDADLADKYVSHSASLQLRTEF